MDGIEIVEKVSSCISPKKLYNKYIKDDTLTNVYGDYNTFVNAIFVKELKRIVYNLQDEKEKENFYWVIICKKKFWSYVGDLIEYFIEYYNKRKDLSLWLRFKLSIIKTVRWVRRINFAIDIFNYSHFSELYNKKIKKLFDEGKTSNVYIYKLNSDLYFKYQLAMKYKR